MRILHIGYLFDVGGAETMLVDIINRQVEFAEVALCIINDRLSYPLLDTLDKRVKKILIKRKEGSHNLFKFIQLNWKINRFHPDIIHVHQDIIAKVLPCVFAPKILTVHDVGIQLQCLNQFRTICSISQAVQKDIKVRLNKDSVVVYNGIDVDRVRKRKSIYDKQTPFRILQISRLVHEKKGQDILILAVSDFRKRNPEVNISLDFIGTGTSEDYLREISSKLGLAEIVRFLGEKDRAYIYESIANYELLVQPSRYEGFGLTVIEGLAAKIPVLSSDNDGPEEILQSNKYGFLFKNGNEEDCYLQLKEIYTRYNSLEPMVESAYEYVRNNFDINHTVQAYRTVYENVLKS